MLTAAALASNIVTIPHALQKQCWPCLPGSPTVSHAGHAARQYHSLDGSPHSQGMIQMWVLPAALIWLQLLAYDTQQHECRADVCFCDSATLRTYKSIRLDHLTAVCLKALQDIAGMQGDEI